MKEAVRIRLGLQLLPQGLLSKSAPLTTTLRTSVFTLNSEEHAVQVSGLSFPKKSPQMTMIMNYLFFEAIEYISKWGGSRNDHEISNLAALEGPVSQGSCKTHCSCNSISLEDQAELTHTQLSMRWMKIFFFYRIPLVSTWVLTKPVLETDLQFSKLHSRGPMSGSC